MVQVLGFRCPPRDIPYASFLILSQQLVIAPCSLIVFVSNLSLTCCMLCFFNARRLHPLGRSSAFKSKYRIQDLEQLRRVLLPCLDSLDQVVDTSATQEANRASLLQLIRRTKDALAKG